MCAPAQNLCPRLHPRHTTLCTPRGVEFLRVAVHFQLRVRAGRPLTARAAQLNEHHQRSLFIYLCFFLSLRLNRCPAPPSTPAPLATHGAATRDKKWGSAAQGTDQESSGRRPCFRLLLS